MIMIKNEKRYLLAVIFIIFLFFAIRIPFIKKEFAPEEVFWIRAGQGVATTGFPWVYIGEQSPGAWAVWKGPLFPWLLGAAFKFIGENEIVARLIPLLFSAGQILLLFLLSIKIFGNERGKIIGLLAALLTAINPFAVQNAVQIDIDGGLVGFFVLLTIYLAWPILTQETYKKTQWFFIIIASAAGFLTRFDTAIITFFSLTLFALFNKGIKNALKLSTLFIISIIASLTILAVYNNYFGQIDKTLDPIYTTFHIVKLIALSKAGLSNEGGAVSTRFTELFPNLNLGYFTKASMAFFPTAAFYTVSSIWITIPLSIILVFMCFKIIKDKKWKEKEFLFLILNSGLIIAAFAIAAPSFNYPRYIHSALLILILILAAYLTEWLSNIKISYKKISILFLTIIIFIELSPLKILLFHDRIRSNIIIAGVAVFLALVSSAATALISKSQKSIGFFIVGVLTTYFAFSTLILIKDFQKPYSLNAYYGNYGFKKAGAFLKKEIKPNDILVTIDTVGYYYGGRYYDLNPYSKGLLNIKPTIIAIYNMPPDRFKNTVQDKKLIASFGTIEIYR